MGTRSLTYVYDGEDPIVCMYRQFDGYPTGHGKELAEFLSPVEVINGISGNSEMGRSANGMGCLAAQMVAQFKTEVGNIYLHAPILGRDDWQEYEYHVFKDKVKVMEMGSDEDTTIFDGSWKEFTHFCSSEELV
jgi:hypothetical protein